MSPEASCSLWGTVKPRFGVRWTRPGPTWFYSSMVEGAASPVAVCLQLILEVRLWVNLYGQFLTQFLQLLAEIRARALEKAEHQ